ncbi:MAG: beta-lactamase family protein [Candidatus Eremiobacteraeota bacterium]|nr:beta-lactamase family protein [Candidatus Eremiobacteraeota bacterium]
MAAFLFFTSGPLTPCNNAEAQAPSLAQSLDQYLATAAKSGFSGGIVVERDGEAILKKGYGIADTANSTPFSARTVAQIGSIAKTFTAMAIAQLAIDGKIDLNAPVSKYLPEAAQPAASATVKELLTHRSGIRAECGDDFQALSESELLTKCMALPLKHSRGQYAYSNMAYSILAAVIAHVSRQDWETYLRAHIWEPAGMTRTLFADSNVADAEFAAGSLHGQRQAPIIESLRSIAPNDWNLQGCCGVESSLDDMQRFGRYLFSDTSSLSPAVRRLMLAPLADDDSGAQVGFGLYFRRDASGRLSRVGHSGSDGVFFSYFGWLPQQQIRFYFVGTNGEDAVRPVVVHVIDILSHASRR